MIKMEQELVDVSEKTRRVAIWVAIFSALCVCFIGVIPDEYSFELFLLFHMFSAIIAFGGSSIYIVLYCFLIYKGPKTPMYKGPPFKKGMAFYGYSIFFLFIVTLILTVLTVSNIIPMELVPMSVLEWSLLVSINVWQIIIASYLYKYAFSGISGLYYKRADYEEQLKEFQQSLGIMEKLDLTDDPVVEQLKTNIEFLKKAIEKDKK